MYTRDIERQPLCIPLASNSLTTSLPPPMSPQGKLELEVEVLSEEEALLKPAARSRDEPNQNPHLEEPNRPATSFLWFTSPLKTFKHIIWKHYKWHIIGGIVIVLLVILLVILIYTAPVGQCGSLYVRDRLHLVGQGGSLCVRDRLRLVGRP